ncbi:MAG: hypothetical protein ACJ749_14985 [Flavisolibacter sp.]
MEEKELSGQESLRLIQQMILTAKTEQKDDGKGWIMWGWLLFLASVLTVLSNHYHWFKAEYLFWNAFAIVSILLFLVRMIMKSSNRKTAVVRTYTKDLFDRLNRGFFISLVFIIIGINVADIPLAGFSLLVNLYAFWILIYGSALNFKPSIIAAYVTWAIGIASLFMKTFEMVMVMHALAALCGYIIPGHIANNEFKKIQTRDKELQGV